MTVFLFLLQKSLYWVVLGVYTPPPTPIISVWERYWSHELNIQWQFLCLWCGMEINRNETSLLSTSHMQTDSKWRVFTQASFCAMNLPTLQPTLRDILGSASGWSSLSGTSMQLCQSWGCFIWWGPQLSGRWALFWFPKPPGGEGRFADCGQEGPNYEWFPNQVLKHCTL